MNQSSVNTCVSEKPADACTGDMVNQVSAVRLTTLPAAFGALSLFSDKPTLFMQYVGTFSIMCHTVPVVGDWPAWRVPWVGR